MVSVHVHPHRRLLASELVDPDSAATSRGSSGAMGAVPSCDQSHTDAAEARFCTLGAESATPFEINTARSRVVEINLAERDGGLDYRTLEGWVHRRADVGSVNPTRIHGQLY